MHQGQDRQKATLGARLAIVSPEGDGRSRGPCCASVSTADGARPPLKASFLLLPFLLEAECPKSHLTPHLPVEAGGRAGLSYQLLTAVTKYPPPKILRKGLLGLTVGGSMAGEGMVAGV